MMRSVLPISLLVLSAICGEMAAAQDATAECRTSDITLAEFRSLTPKMDGANPRASTVEEYQDGTPKWRTDLDAAGATQMTHAESIALLRDPGVKFTPELKTPSVEMPFDGMSQADYAQKMIDEYKAANIPPEDVWAQSFNLDDIFYWIENEPEFRVQAVYPMDDSHIEGLDGMNPDSWSFVPAELKARRQLCRSGFSVPADTGRCRKDCPVKIVAGAEGGRYKGYYLDA